MGDDKYAEFISDKGVDPLRHDSNRVNVQTGIGLIQNCNIGLQGGELQDLGAFLLTSRESIIEESTRKLVGYLQQVHFAFEQLPKLWKRDSLSVAVFRFAPSVDCHPKKVRNRHSRNCHGILEGQEEAHARALVRSQSEDTLALK